MVARPAKSEPAPGSENSWHHTSSPVNIGRRNRSFTSSLPCVTIVGPARSMKNVVGAVGSAPACLQALFDVLVEVGLAGRARRSPRGSAPTPDRRRSGARGTRRSMSSPDRVRRAAHRWRRRRVRAGSSWRSSRRSSRRSSPRQSRECVGRPGEAENRRVGDPMGGDRCPAWQNVRRPRAATPSERHGGRSSAGGSARL